ncbi:MULTISPECIES: MmgE/PrpD family protein [Bradyrhizobium]|uniref:2-methylcitrate dehydratase PrpD n=2 Tax=Bradyrhizobium TaxID=374 RepID=A0ABY0P9X7_9BRAD|nr:MULTISPECIES: MmgE/PrpD family protein [Bradyrhizobium]SDH76493.1 2-methylcitrate dehydratase PrpD [Bradyrhizobium ottawaense]SEE08445.1 2-methylcitrate dehydratase PrpD [Bradyrhizobium lablabi]SHM04120.1 2-methylcitrate dehydratase PrpD [Bradyrhizobium lablabi]
MRQDEAQGAATTFADFVAGTVWEDVTAQDHEAKRSILNFFATALGSSRDPAVAVALKTLLPFSGAATSAIIGRPERLDAMGAAFVNAISANLLDFDDTHLDTIIHPAAPVAAPVLALAQARGFSGQAVLTAFILGVEVECRVGNAVSPGHYARGWHITSTCGVFGAAAACAKLLGLSVQQISNAIGIAASQSAGVVENLPSAAKNVSVGNAARNGLFAALLASNGYSASPKAIEGPLGWARAMGDAPDLAKLTDGLGKSWEIAKNTYKPYPAGIVFHAVIDACFKLRAQLDGRIDYIASISVRGSALLLARGDRPVRNERDARVSIHHCVACALLLGAAGVTEFSETTVSRPDIISLRRKVKAVLDASLPDGAARVTIHLASGETFDEIVMAAKGSLEDPLTDRDIEAKLRECARLGGTDWDIERVIDRVWNLDTLADVSGLMGTHG